jgi:hypothetical protein
MDVGWVGAWEVAKRHVLSPERGHSRLEQAHLVVQNVDAGVRSGDSRVPSVLDQQRARDVFLSSASAWWMVRDVADLNCSRERA